MKETIIRLAGEHVNKFGFRKFTIDNIALEIGISKKTVYKYFTGKQEIISAVVDNYIETEKISSLKALQGKKTWLEKLDAVFFLYSEYKTPLWMVYELRTFFPKEWHKTIWFRELKKQQIGELLEEGISRGEITPTLDPKVIIFILDKVLDNLLDLECLQKHDITANQLVEQVRDIFFFGIIKRTDGGACR